MLTDVTKTNGVSLSNVSGLTASLYPNGSNTVSDTVTVLDSVTVPGDTFATNGDFMEFDYAGTVTGDAATNVFLYFGSDAICDSGVVDPGVESWRLHGKMVRADSATQFVASTFETTTIRVVKLNVLHVEFGAPTAVQLRAVATYSDDVKLNLGIRQFYFQNR